MPRGVKRGSRSAPEGGQRGSRGGPRGPGPLTRRSQKGEISVQDGWGVPAVLLLCCYCAATVLLLWCYCVATVVLLCCAAISTLLQINQPRSAMHPPV
eukprot:2390148-Pyramimonas_sp.AAC.1